MKNNNDGRYNYADNSVFAQGPSGQSDPNRHAVTKGKARWN